MSQEEICIQPALKCSHLKLDKKDKLHSKNIVTTLWENCMMLEAKLQNLAIFMASKWYNNILSKKSWLSIMQI